MRQDLRKLPGFCTCSVHVSRNPLGARAISLGEQSVCLEARPLCGCFGRWVDCFGYGGGSGDEIDVKALLRMYLCRVE